ncbi:DinB family protein [Granulicella rosea]|uniref:DinB family protein n=1 Tax=Granulicella rosea TaxID=474952 RepID=UPI001FEB60B6|nr:DinB family protein [Granulicella rosea]
MRGTLTEVDAVRRQVLHALLLAEEDCSRWCVELSLQQLTECPFDLPSVSFHMLHTVRSLDRLLTYLEGSPLSPGQMADLRTEHTVPASRAELFAEFEIGMATAAARIRRIQPGAYEISRGVGRESLPSTVGGLLIHCAEHTQRHSGQMVTTAKLVAAMQQRSILLMPEEWEQPTSQ